MISVAPSLSAASTMVRRPLKIPSTRGTMFSIRPHARTFGSEILVAMPILKNLSGHCLEASKNGMLNRRAHFQVQIDQPCSQSNERSLRYTALATSDVHSFVCGSVCLAVVHCPMFNGEQQMLAHVRHGFCGCSRARSPWLCSVGGPHVTKSNQYGQVEAHFLTV